MTDLDPRTRDHLAADYVLGTLDRAARASIESRMRTDAALRAAVAEWERRLAPLAESVTPIEPPKRVWAAIDRRFHDQVDADAKPVRIPAWQCIGFWRNWSLAASAVAAALVIWVGVTLWLQPAFSPTHVGLIQAADSQPAWLVRLDAGQRRYQVAALGVDDPGPDKDYELWLVLPDAPQPLSLGLLPRAGDRAATFGGAVPDDLPSGAVLAVSLEAAGGSTTGVPQGPVQFQGQVYQAES